MSQELPSIKANMTLQRSSASGHRILKSAHDCRQDRQWLRNGLHQFNCSGLAVRVQPQGDKGKICLRTVVDAQLW